MKYIAALFSAILALSLSSLAAAQSTSGDTVKDKAGMNADANAKAGAGASDDMDKDKDKKKAKSAKKSGKKSKAKDKDKQSKAAGGASASRTPDRATTSSPSQATGTPGSSNQGSVHNDETKK